MAGLRHAVELDRLQAKGLLGEVYSHGLRIAAHGQMSLCFFLPQLAVTMSGSIEQVTPALGLPAWPSAAALTNRSSGGRARRRW